MPSIAYTARAGEDLDKIWNYVVDRSQSREIADGLIARIETTAASYTAEPLIGELRPELAPNLRCFPVGNYVVYYLPIRNGIQIVRVLHGARDVRRQFRRRRR